MTAAPSAANATIDGINVIQMLRLVGNWVVDSPHTIERVNAILYCGDNGLIRIRQHYADMYPNGVKAYEVTDKGLELLDKVLGPEVATEAEELRTFYRENTAAENWRFAKRAPKNGRPRRN